jgi:hypothetical protein
MSILDIIKKADFDSLRSREYELLEHINTMMREYYEEPENFLTYWMAIHDNMDFGLAMFELFMNTCNTALHSSKQNQVMKVFAYPTMCGAVCRQNIGVLEHVKCYVDPDTILQEIESEFGIEDNEVYRWYQDNFS